MFLRKFLVSALTTVLTGFFLNLFFAIMDGFDHYDLFAVFGVLLVGVAPFILFIGLPVSILSDYLTKNLNGKQRNKKAFLIHSIFGLIIGVVLSYFFEHFLLSPLTLIAALIFWIVDEIFRKKFK
ncbi:hypothetical protein [Bacillus sp. AK128]